MGLSQNESRPSPEVLAGGLKAPGKCRPRTGDQLQEALRQLQGNKPGAHEKPGELLAVACRPSPL